jgi:hypothetical protein
MSGWRSRRHTIQTSRPVKILDGPGSADAADHPSQNGPKIPVQDSAIERLKRIHDSMDFEGRREGLTAPADEDKRIGDAGRGADKSRLRKPLAVEFKRPDEEVAELGIMRDAVFRQSAVGSAFSKWIVKAPSTFSAGSLSLSSAAEAD